MNLRFETITDLKTAEKIWRQFSPGIYAYDEWDVRYAYYAPYNFPLNFVAGYLDEKPIGVLPLQYNPEKDFIEFFAGDFMEYNHVLIDPDHKELAVEFYRHLPEKNLCLRDFFDGDASLPNYEKYDETFTLNLKEFQNLEDFLAKRFTSHSRKKRKKILKVYTPKVEVKENNFADLEYLIKYNKERFGKESSFDDPRRKTCFENLLKLNYRHLMQSFLVDNKVEAVAQSMHYKNYFIYVMSGANIADAENLGNFVIMTVLEKAFASGKKILDAGRNPSGWKDHWHLDPKPLFRIIRNK